ncbi:MAG: filamentous hemagglutinin family protein [Terrimicrobiaceae bacterium]
MDTRGLELGYYDVTRYTDGGEIRITSQSGDVALLLGSDVSVSAAAGGGNAGFVTINAPLGQFSTAGILEGQSGIGGRDGSFRLDAGTIASFETLRDALNNGQFNEKRDLRVRNGDIEISGYNTARNFLLSTDNGGITVTGTIDASGETGGNIVLSARNDLIVQSGALLTVAGQQFSNSGKGGAIFLEAGASTGGSAGVGTLGIEAGSTLDLSVAAFRQGVTTDPNGNYQDPTSSAFLGQFQGTLHLRTPQISGNTDVSVAKILGTIQGASSVVVEGYRIYAPASGTMNIALRNQINTDANSFVTPNEAALRTKLFGGTVNTALDNILVIAPGAEVINMAGDLALGLANPTGSSNVEARSTADWDLSSFRYGSRLAPGVLTLRARGDLVFNNTLSDGFTPIAATSARGNTSMWLATPQEINPLLPLNTQSWSYRLTAGSDLAAANASEVLPLADLLPNRGSVLVGEFYPAIPNTATSGGGVATGLNGLTANTIRISTSATDLGTRYEVIRTGTGDISVNAGRDVQLRNQFATIYSAGVAIPLSQRTRIFQNNDFVVPLVTQTGLSHPSQGTLGAIQQPYAPYYTMAGGDVSIFAGNNIGRFTVFGGNVIADTSRQIPSNWLYRRGYVDETGNFGVGGVGSGGLGTVTDPSASTTWWVDFSNFFQGFGSFGGGDISLAAGQDVINADAVVVTNARMAGRNPSLGVNIAPDIDNLLEYGGGDLVVRAGRNIDGGTYYLEKGNGVLFAGGEITTNAAKTISRGILAGPVPEIRDPGTWLPTLLFLGKSSFDVSARSNVLIGPASNAFGLPQGINNKFWYKTQFTTFDPEASVDIRSFGGSVTHRLAVSLPGDSDAQPVLFSAIQNQNTITPASASNFQPWIRLSERSIVGFRTPLTVNAPSIRSTAFSGDINIVGTMNLFPSSSGTLELVASGAVDGLQRTGQITANIDGVPTIVNAYSSASVNVSDADPARLPSITAPSAFQSLVGRELLAIRDSLADPLRNVTASFQETGAFTGAAASISTKQALHAQGVLHRTSTEPVRIYATGGSISGLTLFTPKLSQIVAEQDITDIAFYLQNANEDSVTIVSAGRDIIPFNENSPTRVAASDLALRNVITDAQQPTVVGTLTQALPGDIQINGPGALEVLAGRNIDLGTGANFVDGRGTGITSIGRERNPFLPIDGARLVVFAGIKGIENEGPALGLAGSNFNFEEFIDTYLPGGEPIIAIDDPELLEKLEEFSSLSPEQQNILALDVFFALLRQSAAEASQDGGTYALGNAASALLFGDSAGEEGSIQTRSRDIRTASGGGITIGTPSGGVTLASDIFGNPLTPPGIVTAAGGPVSIFMRDDLDIGQARVFTLRGGDLTIWSSEGDIAAGTAAKTVVSAPPTRVLIDSTSAEVVTDLGGLATGGGIGVLASVAGVKPGGVFLIAPQGTIDAGDAGIRATGDITLAADAVLNADNISAGGTSTGVPAAPTVAAPSIGGLSSASSSTAATSNAATQVADQARPTPTPEEEIPSEIVVEVLGYGGGEGSSE